MTQTSKCLLNSASKTLLLSFRKKNIPTLGDSYGKAFQGGDVAVTLESLGPSPSLLKSGSASFAELCNYIYTINTDQSLCNRDKIIRHLKQELRTSQIP